MLPQGLHIQPHRHHLCQKPSCVAGECQGVLGVFERHRQQLSSNSHRRVLPLAHLVPSHNPPPPKQHHSLLCVHHYHHQIRHYPVEGRKQLGDISSDSWTDTFTKVGSAGAASCAAFCGDLPPPGITHAVWGEGEGTG